jgi:hypothetical protein
VLFTASQRQGIGVGGAVGQRGHRAGSALKNDAASAGLGFFGDARLPAAPALNLSAWAPRCSWDGAAFVPVRVITSHRRATTASMSLQSTRIEAGAGVRLHGAPATGTAAPRWTPSCRRWRVTPCCCRRAAAGDPCTVRTVTANTVDATADTLADPHLRQPAVATTPRPSPPCPPTPTAGPA